MRMNLSEAVRTWSIRQGKKKAISGSFELTYEELNSLASQYAKCILNTTNGKSEKIAIICNNNIEFIILLLGIIRSGNVFVLINPNLSLNQINTSLNSINCNYYVSNAFNPQIECQYISTNGAYNTKADIDSENYLYTGLTEDAGVIFSSGTTGEPKALLRNSFSILSEIVQWIIELQLNKEISFLIPRPLYYTGGFVLLYATLFCGGRVDLLNDISCESVLNYLDKVHCDWAFIVPSVIREIISINRETKMSDNVLTMGSPIFYSDKKAFYNMFKCNIIEVWGNSEGLGTITEPMDLFDHPHSIGRPFFTDFLDVEGSIENREGVLFGVSDNEFSEYIGKPNLTKEVLRDGLIFSEDIGYKDNEGYFYLTGRTKDLIVVDGIKVFPKDIELAIIQNENVIDCAVFSVQDTNGNDVVSAALVLNSELSAKDIIFNTNKILAPHEKIKQYILLNSIPRNHGGKVDKKAILDLFNNK